MNIEDIQKQFAEDVANHGMTIITVSGVHRHLMFDTPGQVCDWFEIVSWPGALCIRGDHGTFVFSRTHDMFDFFDRNGTIKPHYWAEKLIAVDHPGSGYKRYSEAKFRANIKEYFDNYVVDIDDMIAADLWQQIEEDVLYYADDEHRAIQEANAFSYPITTAYGRESKFEFTDFFECDNSEYTPQYIWCICAIAWGVYQYNKEIA